jgi:hypothetical protein
MKRNLSITALILTGLLFITACGDSFWNCIEGNGSVATVRRVVDDFTNITSNGDFIVDVSIGNSTSVSVEADENLLSYIETYIRGNTLYIETQDNHCIQSRERVYVHVVTPSVYQLKLSGSGIIYCDSVNTDELKYIVSGSGTIESKGLNTGFIDANISGSGEIILSGTSAETDLMISGSGNIKAINLDTDKCIATISGSGSIYTSVNELLDVMISGSGNVIYKGDPELSVNISGSGRVVRY